MKEGRKERMKEGIKGKNEASGAPKWIPGDVYSECFKIEFGVL